MVCLGYSGGLHADLLGTAIVENVRDGSTVRVRLLLSDSEHQFVNVAMAGVRTPRTSTRQGEPAEQWGEEVNLHISYFIPFRKALTFFSISWGVGQVIYRVEVTSSQAPCDAPVLTAIDCYPIPSRFNQRAYPSDDLHWQRYVYFPFMDFETCVAH